MPHPASLSVSPRASLVRVASPALHRLHHADEPRPQRGARRPLLPVEVVRRPVPRPWPDPPFTSLIPISTHTANRRPRPYTMPPVPSCSYRANRLRPARDGPADGQAALHGHAQRPSLRLTQHSYASPPGFHPPPIPHRAIRARSVLLEQQTLPIHAWPL